MKKTFLLTLFTLLISVSCGGQSKIPKTVLDKFEKQYPSARQVEWEAEVATYEVEFVIDRKEYKSYYAYDSEWIQTSCELLLPDVPQSVMKVFNESKYSGSIIEEIKLYTFPNKLSEYVFEVEQPAADMIIGIREDAVILYEKPDL